MTNTQRPPGALRLALAPIRYVDVHDAQGTGDGSWTISGYAAVYDQETVLYDGRWFRMREEIAPGAFTNVLGRVQAGSELVHLNFGHDMNSVVAATDVAGIGGLELEEDFRGLRFFARVDSEDPDARRMAVKMQRGVVSQASFAFTIMREELAESGETEDGRIDEKWRILEIGSLFDVCACAQGAYPQTESQLRSLAAASLSGRAEMAGPDRRGATPGESIVVPEEAGEKNGRALAHLRMTSQRRTRELLRRGK